MTNKATLINQDSGKTEYYTPKKIADAAHRVMGGIDLDPASSKTANQYIRAQHIYTIEDDGLTQPWYGRVFMNHPFSRSNNKIWPQKLVDEYKAENVKEAICICYASTSEKWFQCLAPYPQCFLSPRTDFYLPTGELKDDVTKGSVITYFGHNLLKFAQEFGEFGTVKVTYSV